MSAGFAHMQELAANLPTALAAACTSRRQTCGYAASFFLPGHEHEVQMQLDATLIRDVALVLGDLPDWGDNHRSMVLCGVYCYLFHVYDSPLEYFRSDPLIAMLREHIGTYSPSEFTPDFLGTLYTQLRDFLQWSGQEPPPTPACVGLQGSIIAARPDMLKTLDTLIVAAESGKYSPSPITFSEAVIKVGLKGMI